MMYCRKNFIQFWNNPAAKAKQQIQKVWNNIEEKKPYIAKIIQDYPIPLLKLTNNNEDAFLKLIKQSDNPLKFLSSLEKVNLHSTKKFSTFLTNIQEIEKNRQNFSAYFYERYVKKSQE